MIGIYIFNNMGNMQERIFPQLNQTLPIFILIILDSNPSVVIPKSCIVRKDQRCWLVLKMNNPVGIIGGRVNYMSGDLFYGPVLRVSSQGYYIFRQAAEHRLP